MEVKVNTKNKHLTVIDLFCGGGGFSEGFKQQGFKVVQGIDCWKPAIETFNHNFRLSCDASSILDFSESVERINALPDTDIILGSPPCVSFSSSNKCGNADKQLGIDLIEIFLRIVAIKKHQPNSRLKAWFMENVVNAAKYAKDKYTFRELDLTPWAKKHKINPNKIAIRFEGNHRIINSSDFGVAQVRKRLFVGEIIKTKSFPILEMTNKQNPVSVENIFAFFPHPFQKQKQVADPNYKNIKINTAKLTDHFYDTGIYKSHWDYSKHCKTNHPYMGKMSFPENLNNPSRTVTATKLDNSREALIYPSELNRVDDGQYRTPTVREVGILMSFPITYQFIGVSENSKWALVGNAVCPLVSNAIAKAILKELNLPILDNILIQEKPKLKGVNNINTFKRKVFDNPPIRKRGSRFRRHPFKVGNMTITLSNYCLRENGLSDKKWRTTVTYGTGINYKLQEINKTHQEKIEQFIGTLNNGNEFIERVQSDFLEKVAFGKDLQDMYEKGYSNGKLQPIELIEEAKNLVNLYANGDIIDTKSIFKYKTNVHKKQLYALYTINQITQIANKRK